MGTKTILCYGDSNTWGANPRDLTRFPKEVRWPGQLQLLLGESWCVIEEGSPNRTTSFSDPLISFRNGAELFPVFLESHGPLDVVVVMLGTNDSKTRIGGDIKDALLGLMEIGNLAKSSGAEILFVSPPQAAKPIRFDEFDEGITVQYLHQLRAELAKMALQEGFHFLDSSEFVSVSPLDNIHLDETAHLDLARAINTFIERELL